MQPVRRKASIPEQHRFAGRWRKPVLWRLAENLCSEGVGEDQAGFDGNDLARGRRIDREIEPVAMGAIVAPFPVGAKIGQRGFHLDDHERSIRAKTDQIGTATAGKRHFGQRRIARRPQQTANAPRDAQSVFGLASIRRQAQRLEHGVPRVAV